MTSQQTTDFLPQIDAASCIGCELCVKVCPHDVLTLVDDLPVIAKPEKCEYTGACQEICPTGAISLSYVIVFSGEGEE